MRPDYSPGRRQTAAMPPKQLRAAARLTILRQFGRAGLLTVLRRVRAARTRAKIGRQH